MSSSDSRTTTSDEETSKMPVVEDSASSSRTGKGSGSSAKGSGSTSKGSGNAAKGASRSPVKAAASPSTGERRGPRRVRLTLSRIDPFSVMKLSLLIGIAIGIATVVAVALLWNLVDAVGLWASIDQLGRDLNSGDPLPFMTFFEFEKFFSYGVIVAVVNVVIITALGTLLAFLYNLVAALLGGLRMTFTDE